MARGRSDGRGWHQQKRVLEFRNMSTSKHMAFASAAPLNWSTFDALINTAKPKVLRFLADRRDIPAMWQHRALQALRERNIEIPPSEWENSLELALQDENTSSSEKEALRLKLKECRRVKFQNKLEDLSKNHLHLDLDDIAKIKKIVKVEDSAFREMFSSWGFELALGHYSNILSYLYSPNVRKGDLQLSSRLIDEFKDFSSKKWKIPNEAILQWPLEIFSSFLYLNLTFNLDRVDARNLFDNLIDMVKLLNQGIDDLFKKAQLNEEREKEETKRRAIELREREERIKENQRLGMAKAAEREARAKHERAIIAECDELKKEIERYFPWPVPCKNASNEARERLKTLGISIVNGKFFAYKPFPTKFDYSSPNNRFLISSEDQGMDVTSGQQSILESFTREFPKEKRRLVEDYQDFARYLNHKKRYLCESVYFMISNDQLEIRMRIDQVALIKSEGVFQGCWVVTIFGLPDFMARGIEMMRAQVLSKAEFAKDVFSNQEMRNLFDSVFYVKKKTSEGARSWIGLFIELVEFIYSFGATKSHLSIEPLPAEILKHREKIFETALQRTFWQGERSSGDGTDFCEICGREIWDAPSIARRIGPDCWQKVRFTDHGRAVLSSSSYGRSYDENRDRLAIPYTDWVASIAHDAQRFASPAHRAN